MSVIHTLTRHQDAIVFGQHDNLVGVWSGRVLAKKRRDTAVIFLTAGMLHHCGPYRLHVDLANRLHSCGIESLRFDLSGIGESLAVGSTGSSIDRATKEIGQAIDWMSENQGIRKVILFGLCSGADDAIHTATVDPRIAGVIAMDGCGYRTVAFHWHRLFRHYLPRILSATKWSRVTQRIWRSSGDAPKSLRFGDDIREFPRRDTAQQQLINLVNQKVQLHFIYTGGISDYYNHQSQFSRMFPKLRKSDFVSNQFFPEMDHVAFLCEDRKRLVDHICQKTCSMVETHSQDCMGKLEASKASGSS